MFQTPNTYFSQIGFSNFFHLSQHHGGDLLWVEGFTFTLVFNLNLGATAVIDHIERPVLHIGLNNGVIEPAANQSFGICKIKSISG